MSGRQICRETDMGQGLCKPCKKAAVGNIKTGAATVTAGGLRVARDGDRVEADCGHSGLIMASQTSFLVEGQAVAMVGDAFVGEFSGSLILGIGTVTG